MPIPDDAPPRRSRSTPAALLLLCTLAAAVFVPAADALRLGFLRDSNDDAAEDQSTDVVFNWAPYFVIFRNGSYVRSGWPPAVPAGSDNATGVESKDVVIDAETGVFVRLFLPNASSLPTKKKLPVVIYFHGGAFVIETAVDAAYNALAESIARKSRSIVVTVQYRLGPEHHCPAATDDAWAALQWVVSRKDPWVAEHGNTARLFLAGDSAGANMVHNVLMRAGAAGGPKVEGGILLHPWFDGRAYLAGEKTGVKDALSAAWRLYCPTAEDGLDDPRMNPLAKGAPSLSALGCQRLLVAVGGIDSLRARGRAYYAAVMASGWRGQAELFESAGEDHCFFVHEPRIKKAEELMKYVAAFIKRRAAAGVL